VLNLQRFSLANYLRYARPWVREPDHVLLSVLFGIAQVQHENAARIGELLVQRHASVEPGTFPMVFTGLNDLSARHVAPHVVEDLERIIHELRLCAEVLRDDAIAREIVEAILRDEQRHAQILREEVGHVRRGVSPRQQPANAHKRSIPILEDFYGDALDRWTNEGGALGKNHLTVRFVLPSPQNGQRSDLERLPELALHA
jgi:hypothetical protein